jgi:EAL domain-containing protein (putative c-di-GMP-specific phosphodiesterase class I)
MDGNSKLCYYEVLIRLSAANSSTAVCPEDLVNIAESVGFISSLDKKILDHAIHKLSDNPNLTLSINMSNLSIQSDYFVTYLQKKLSNNLHASKRLIIEITETAPQIDHNQICRFIDLVHDFGGKIAIDDFGTGYTSWRQLRDLSIDIVKIDGSFIQNILYDELSVIFVKSVVKIAKFLKIKIVAEFVENEEIYRFLQELGIDYFQGYYFSKGISKI